MAPIRVSPSSSGSSSPYENSSPRPELYQATEPIAIVGIGCRLPGGVNSSSKFWELLEQEKTGKCKIPPTRFNVDAFYHPDGVDRPGSMNTQGGYFLEEDPRLFDPGFFGISPLEATYMDPQQRKLLEVVYEAFESAGASLEDVSGSNVGCYVGNFTVDFQVMQTRDPEYLHRYSATGMGTTILANRINHVFNLKGPSFVLDTACSSSLYCLHVACTALERGECDSAVVAGANLIQSPEQHLGTMKAGVLSGTSTCHTFSTEADGYGRADGIGALYLKRLSDAIRDNDPVRAVVRGTAINSNGRTPGITLPSSEGQESVIRKSYEKANLDFGNTAYVECHGTGTPVGDPIEVEGLSRVFGKRLGDPLLIGSVKTNLGHSEAASGISGVIKTVLALEKGLIPATVGVNQINPKIKTGEWNAEVVTTMTPWPPTLGPRRAGINSFGYGGANSHAILDAASHYLPSAQSYDPPLRSTYLIPISASNEASLKARVEHLNRYVSTGHVDIRDLVYTLGHRRSHFSQRGFMLLGPNNLSESIKIENLRTSATSSSSSQSQYAFVFTGQGAQWPQMCKTLFNEFPVFARTISEMDTVLRNLPHPPTWGLSEAILESAETSKIHDVTRSQPTCTAIQVAMTRLLASWNILPSAVVGHSSGEIAASFAAGLISAAEAITTAYYRGYVLGNQIKDGAMIAVGLGRDDVETEIQSASMNGRAVVACVNSPESVTVSGDRDAVESLLASFTSRGIFARKLNTGGRAYHSHHMAAIGNEYEELLGAALNSLDPSFVMPVKGPVTWISSVSAQKKSDGATPAYWRANLESPVLFSNAVEKISELGNVHFIELGPHSALQMPIKQINAKLNIDFSYSSAITRGKNEVESILSLVGGLYQRGDKIAWASVNDLAGSPGSNLKLKPKVLHDLPPYCWSYDTLLWNECRSSSEFRHRKHPRHELLGSLIPGGNGLEKSWRNIIRLADIKWLSHHRLDDTIVFPGAGYIAMAIEAVRQVSGGAEIQQPSFKLQNVNILAALVVHAEQTADVELFTTLRPGAVTSTASSKYWWDFDIVSFEDGLPTTRAVGSIGCGEESPIKRKYSLNQDLLENTQPRVWYQNLIRVGLNFGPAFQSIQEFWVSRMKEHNICTTRVPFLRDWESKWDEHLEYVVHPITIDAMLQTAIIASTSGSPRALQAKVPVSFGSMAIQTPPSSSCNSPWYIDSEARVVGFGAAEIDAELRTTEGKVAAQISNVKLAPYNASFQADEGEKRHPMLRVLWKPDVHGLGLMPEDAFSQYLDAFATEAHSEVADEGLLKMGAALDLLSHKSPALRILELGNTVHQITNATIDLLQGNTSFPRVLKYTTGYISEDNKTFGSEVDLTKGLQSPVTTFEEIESQVFDVVLLPGIEATDAYLGTKLSVIKELISPEGVLLALSPSKGYLHSTENGFEAITCTLNSGAGRIILSHPIPELRFQLGASNSAIVVVDRGISSVSKAITEKLSSLTGREVPRLSLNEVSPDKFPSKSIVFSLLEFEGPLLAESSNYDMRKIKVITDNASKLVWVTGGNLLEGKNPKFGLANGLSRALMMEQPSLSFYTFDVDNIDAAPHITANNIISVLSANRFSTDYEFAQRNGVVHISRFVPDNNLNTAFRQKQDDEFLDISLEEAKPAQLAISEAGNFDSIHFKQITLPESLEAGKVQVAVKTVGLNAKDYYVLGGKTETKDATCMLEFGGVVERVGCDVDGLNPGDRVVVMAPAFFRTSEIVPAWACKKLLPDESFDVMCVLPVVYATALYALRDRAQIQPGESVLIHSGAGGVGIAAIQVAQQAGAEIFTTVSSEAKKEYLIERFGLKRQNIFSSRDTSFFPELLEATAGRGVDVVLNSLVGDLLHASWKCCASFGRFIEIGKADQVQCGKLEMEQFLQNATFSAFDLSNMYYHTNAAYHKKWASLLNEVVELYRANKIEKIEPLEVFDVADVVQSLRYFSSRNRMGKVVVSLENSDSRLQVRPQKYKTEFTADKTYVMVGCLGGLGRSMTKWMMGRGARKFSFLGRSGTDKASARQLIEDLEQNGASCTVVRGDVCNVKDVQKLIDHVDGPIGGVVQAAMGLNESLFTSMSNNFWHTGIDPKVQGTIHLHQAIQGRDGALEFFLMTSSVSGSVGTATESNYCAGNYFLDCFARYRQSQGLPATSIGLGMISEVGYLHENPEIEQLLLRKGIQAINEDELLQIIDIALSDKSQIPHAYDALAHSHILTGLEPFGLKEMRKKGFEGSNPTLNDPRAAVLARALDGQNDLASKGQTGRLPAEVAAQIEGGSTVPDAILNFIAKRFSNLVLLPLDKVEVAKPLTGYGMDSMIAAEFRSWFFQSFKVDIPFLELLSKTVTLSTLSQTVVTEIEQDS